MKYIIGYNESIEFDTDFAISKIKEHFNFETVKDMLDKEIMEWTPDEEDLDWYTNNSNGEAESIVIQHIINWYTTKYPSSEINEEELEKSIQKEFNFLNY